MANGEEVEPKPEDGEKTAHTPKRRSPKGRSGGAKSESEAEPATEPSEAADALSDEEAGTQKAETVSSSVETAREAPKAPTATSEPAASKPKSRIQLLQYERRVGNRRR
jgi:hypothetical protein